MAGLSPDDVESLWARFDCEAQAAKFSHQALLRFEKFYGSLDEADRGVVDKVLTSWIRLGLDSRRRFDALAVIQRFDVRAALPALREELSALDDADGPAVPFERSKLVRTIGKLEAGTGSV